MLELNIRKVRLEQFQVEYAEDAGHHVIQFGIAQPVMFVSQEQCARKPLELTAFLGMTLPLCRRIHNTCLERCWVRSIVLE